MSLRLGPYPEYRDSGLPWLRELPAHWSVARIKHLFSETDERSGDGQGTLLSLTRARGLVPQTEATNRLAGAENLSNYKVCKPGYLVMNRMQAWSGMFAVASQTGLVSPDYSVFQPKRRFEVSFFARLFKTPRYVDQFAQASKGIGTGFNRLYTPEFGGIRALIPSDDEQSAISAFLDHADGYINRLGRAKIRLIALLNSQKQAIIHRAITRGLDPNVRLKPSGVEWLGEVPEHWSLKRLKFVATITSGQVDPRVHPYCHYILIAPNHIEKCTGRLLAEETAEHQGADSGKYLVQEGQIIYSKIRPNLRKATIATTCCLCSADMYPLSFVPSELRREFAVFLLLSDPFTRYAVDCSMRVAMPKVNREALSDCWMWYPDLSEQDDIVAVLRQELQPIDSVILRTEREIDLIREYRSRLIADVVTGKLDVRGVELPALGEVEHWDDADAQDDDTGDAEEDADSEGGADEER